MLGTLNSGELLNRLLLSGEEFREAKQKVSVEGVGFNNNNSSAEVEPNEGLIPVNLVCIQTTVIVGPLLLIRRGVSNVQFFNFLQQANLIGSSLKKIKLKWLKCSVMARALPQNMRFYF